MKKEEIQDTIMEMLTDPSLAAQMRVAVTTLWVMDYIRESEQRIMLAMEKQLPDPISLRPVEDLPELLTYNEAASWLRIQLRMLKYWVKEGEINGVQIGKRSMRIHKSELTKFVEEKGIKVHISPDMYNENLEDGYERERHKAWTKGTGYI